MSFVNKNAEKVLRERYLAKNEKGEVVETIPALFERVASTIAEGERTYGGEDAVESSKKEFYDLMTSMKFLPNSPTLMNAGRPLGQLSACFVLPVGDSMEEIFTSIKNAALIHKSGGGTGFSFSRLRSNGSRVKTTGGTASGPISFMGAFNSATETVKQGGCFVADTYIATVRGPVKICELQAGDAVYSWDKEQGFVLMPCTKPWMTKKDTEVWKLETDNGFSVTATPDHPIMNRVALKEDVGYTKLCELTSGAPLMLYGVYRGNTVKKVFKCGQADVWNVEVPGTHNYVVCNEAMTTGFVVSNTRRGANMGILRVDHPDILQFITCKNDLTTLTNFNISVGITKEFMDAVENGGTYNLVNPHNKEVTDTLDAREVFNKIVDSAWRTGEPGIVFLDKINEKNTVPNLGFVESTNPCGEQPLLPYESCNLGSINLLTHLTKGEDGTYSIDYKALKATVHTAVRFLDNVIDVNKFPLPEIEEMTKKSRKVGLGVMGFADMLLRLGIPYNSAEGVDTAREVMKFIQVEAWKASGKLAGVRGVFPAHEGSTLRKPVRNATVTTIAPTGTLSVIAGVSSGVEPVFAFAYVRTAMDNVKLVTTNDILKEVLEERGIYSDALMEKVVEQGTLAHIDEIPEDIKRVFVCAHDISPEWHIRIQAAFQEFTDNAVSKTVNFPSSATREDVATAYTLAYQLGCKGTTIYRDGSRDSQVLTIGKEKKEPEAKAEPEAPVYGALRPRIRPEATFGYTKKVKIGCGNLFITVNRDEQGICEVFTNTGRTGGCPSQSEATARMVSIAIRSGVDPQEIVDQLKGIRCPSCIRKGEVHVTSCPDAIAREIEATIAQIKQEQAGGATTVKVAPPPAINPNATPADTLHAKYCPECGGELQHEGGCVICRGCGYSKCG